MKPKKKKINYKNERVVLSDVLPYEIPVTFTNRHFYEFLVSNQIKYSKNSIKWGKNSDGLEAIVKLLFGFEQGAEVVDQEIAIPNDYRRSKTLSKIPFNFKISHKEKDYRELTIIHPLHQLMMVDFYDTNKELMLYYCNISPFSIRKPFKVANLTIYNDRLHIKNLAYDHEHENIEEFDKEYKSLKTFFAYKNYSNVHKFYESYEYHRCEKKYNKLCRFDISKCFYSIYTHSIAWALLNKDAVKDKLSESKSTFGGQFDALMQYLNYGETNGIVVGPEFSRIFAELILQQIDFKVFKLVKKKFNTDYKVLRYVDDYFVFYNDEKTKEEIEDAFKHQLIEFKLYLNESKRSTLDKPIITDLTIAKQRVSSLMNRSFRIKTFKKKVKEEGEEELKKIKKYEIYYSSNKVITKFKTIIKETNVAYKDILNYTLACIDRKIVELIDIYVDVEEKDRFEARITEALLEILDFAFFIYSVSPRANTTIKLCTVLSKIIKFANRKEKFNHDHKHYIYKKIYDDISLVLKKNKALPYTQIETLYLLIALKELGKEYWLEESVLGDYFNINLEKSTCDHSLNYFSITVLLFYIEKKNCYNSLRETIKNHVLAKIEAININKRVKTTETVLLTLDLLACPYFDDAYKRNLLSLFRITDTTAQSHILNRDEYWFTNWGDFDLLKELETKRSQEVY